jgi:hypothetical protein
LFCDGPFWAIFFIKEREGGVFAKEIREEGIRRKEGEELPIGF